MARMEYYILNDVDLSFKDVLKRSLAGEPLPDTAEKEEWEKKRAERKTSEAKKPSKEGEEEQEQEEVEEKMDTAESEEPVEEKKEEKKKSKKKARKGKTRKSSGKSEKSEEPTETDEAGENGEVEKKPDEEGEAEEEAEEEAAAPGAEEEVKKKEEEEVENNEDDEPVDKERQAADKAKAVERAAIAAPQLNLQQMEAAIAKGGLGYDQDVINDLMAQTYAASIKWPKDKVLHVRLQHIVAGVETGAWPVPPNSVLWESVVPSDPATPEPNTNRDTSTPLSEVSYMCFSLDFSTCSSNWWMLI